MTAQAVGKFLSRVVQEEGNKLRPYDDATAKPVVAPVGNLSWGWGFNLMQCGSVGLFRVMTEYLVTVIDTDLSRQAWYASLSDEPTRQSVFLDVAYNAGEDLQHHWPNMVAAATVRRWPECAAQCKVQRPDLDLSRYAPLRWLLISGDISL